MLNSKNKIVYNQLMPISEKHHSSQSSRSTCKEVKKWVTNGTISFLIKPKNKEKKEPHISFYSKKSKFSFPFPWFSAAQKPKISNLNQKKKPWTFSIITIHWAKPRSRKGKKCTDPSQNQCVYLNINTVTLIQISQKNKHKTKLGKKKGAFLSVPILDRWWLQTLWDSKARKLFLGEREFVWTLSPNLSDSICVCIKSFLTVFFFFFFKFFIYMRHIHTTNSVWIINWN